MIDRLVQDVIEGLAKGSELSAGEILDALWLAEAFPVSQDGVNRGPGGADPEEEPPAQAPEPPAVDPAQDDTVPLRVGGEPSGYGELVSATEVGFSSPGPIPDALTLPAAMRPLRRIRAPGPEIAVDIEATVMATAEAGGRLMTQLTRPPQRALDLALVVDGSWSMGIWTDTFDEFERLLAQTGAFRSVSRWTLHAFNGEVRLAAGRPAHFAGRSLHPPRRLIDPSGRRLVLVATDGRDRSWYSSGPWDAIKAWCEAMPTTLIQVLPPHYWRGTAIGDPYIAARARRPAAPNSQYATRLRLWANDPGGLPLPVVTLTRQALDTWAEAAVGGSAWASGITAIPPDPESAPVASDDANANDLVNDFFSKASMGAERLARVLARAETLTMPLIAVLQERLAPETGVMERAEILAGGLLEEPWETSSAGQPLFRFRPGIRDILQHGATRFDEWDTYAAVSRYLQDLKPTGGPLRGLIPDPEGIAKIDTSDGPFGAVSRENPVLWPQRARQDAGEEPADALLETLAVSLGLRPGSVDDEELLAAAQTGAAPPIGQESPSPEPTMAASAAGQLDDALFAALAQEIAELDDLGVFTAVVFGLNGLAVWRISRDGNGTPGFSVSQLMPSSLADPAVFFAERMVPLIADARMFIGRGSPGGPLSGVFDLLLAAVGRARVFYCEVPFENLLDEAVGNSLLTHHYELVVARQEGAAQPRTGRLPLETFRLFPRGAASGDRRRIRFRCLPADDHGTVFAVLSRSGPDFFPTPVTVQSAVLAPGDYELDAVLSRPGRVRFEGLPIGPRADPRPWSEIVASVPDQPPNPVPVHLIVALEVSGGGERLVRRIRRVEQLIASADSAENGGRRLAVSLIAYGPHAVERGVREEPATVLAWAANGVRALGELRALASRRPPAAEYARAAQIECALDEVAIRLTGRDGSPVLVTVGGRAPHPAQVDPRTEIIPCRNRVDWRGALARLRDVPRITFGALRDPGARAVIWRELGRDASADLDAVDIERFAERLGLREPVRTEPFPLVARERPPAGEPIKAAMAPERSLDVADISLWGPQSSGKTTFLYALSIALDGGAYGYTMSADDDASELMLVEATAALADEHRFPEPTQGIDYLQWSLTGRRRTGPSGRGLQPEDSPHTLSLRIVDPSGELTRPKRVAGPDRQELLGSLADTTGIVLMFDPIREFERGDASVTTSDLVQQLTRHAAISDPSFNGKLPHHVAVCVTKFDDLRVYATADKLKMLRYDQIDPFRFPRVGDSEARRLLVALCSLARTGDEGERMLTSLSRAFHPERVRFFVTSAVGFYVDPSIGRFDKDDPQNVVKSGPELADSESWRVRGPLHPINIVEPLLWLAEQIPPSQRSLSRGTPVSMPAPMADALSSSRDLSAGAKPPSEIEPRAYAW